MPTFKSTKSVELIISRSAKTFDATDFFIRGQGDMNGAREHETLLIQPTDGFQIHHPRVLGVLRAARVDVAIRLHEGVERVVLPAGRVYFHHVRVRVEQNGQQARVRYVPRDDQKRLVDGFALAFFLHY